MFLLQSCHNFLEKKKKVFNLLYFAQFKNSICVLQLQTPIGPSSDDQTPFNPYVLQRARGLIEAEKGRQKFITQISPFFFIQELLPQPIFLLYLLVFLPHFLLAYRCHSSSPMSVSIIKVI